MCCRLGNGHHCLTFLSVLGFLQALVGTPITVLSVLVLVQGKLGFLLSPFWCGALVGVCACVRACVCVCVRVYVCVQCFLLKNILRTIIIKGCIYMCVYVYFYYNYM